MKKKILIVTCFKEVVSHCLNNVFPIKKQHFLPRIHVKSVIFHFIPLPWPIWFLNQSKPCETPSQINLILYARPRPQMRPVQPAKCHQRHVLALIPLQESQVVIHNKSSFSIFRQ